MDFNNKQPNSANVSPKIRPMPTFFMQQATFSTKKDKETPKMPEVYPPKPPFKSCPPISRLRPVRKQENGARVISFLNEKQNDSDIISKHYDISKMDLFFEQCFIIEGNLGIGSFGKVYKVKSREDGKYYAVKKSRETFKGNADRIRKLEEVVKHESLPPHENCVKFYRAWEEKQRLYIQIELCQMSLSKYAEMHHSIPEKIIWDFLVDLLQAIKHLHDHNLIHMDIKPENIFISHDKICKLGDFGLVIDLNKNDLKEAQEGDPKYLAPEVLKGKFTKAADIFSLGMTILELATDLDVPKSGEAWHQLRSGKFPTDIKHNLSDSLVNIILQMIEPDYTIRPTVDQLLQLKHIQNIINKRNKNYVYSKHTRYFKKITNYVFMFILTIFYFIIYPFKLLINNFTHKSGIHQTSTPKRDNCTIIAPLTLMHIDDDEYDVGSNLHINDSFSTYNNSYGQPLFDSSSSFSDNNNNSDLSLLNNRPISSRKLRTEPAKLKPTLLTPTKTPPWKPNMDSYIGDDTPTKILGPARQKLVFDENDDIEQNNNINSNENDLLKSKKINIETLNKQKKFLIKEDSLNNNNKQIKTKFPTIKKSSSKSHNTSKLHTILLTNTFHNHPSPKLPLKNLIVN